MNEYPIGHIVKSPKFARRGEIRATRKIGGEVAEVMVRWGDIDNCVIRWEKPEDIEVLAVQPVETTA